MKIIMRRTTGLAACLLILCLVQGVSLAGDLRVAVLPFRNSSRDAKYAPLADGMGDMVAAFLGHTKGLALLERAAMEKVLREHELALGGMVDDKTKTKVGKLLKAEYLLTGSVTVLDKKIRINAHLFEVETTRVARSETSQGQIDKLVAVVRGLVRKLAKGLDLELPELKDSEIDESPQVNLHFMRGLGYYYGNMHDHAIAEFMKTVMLEPKHARARYWNGRCYFEQNEFAHATIEFERFLKDFPENHLGPKVKEMLAVCTAKSRKPVPGKKGE